MCVADHRFIQFALGNCYAVHINPLSISLKCTSKGATCKLNQYDSVKRIAFIHVYFCEARNSTRPACLRLENRYNTSLIDSNRFYYP